MKTSYKILIILFSSAVILVSGYYMAWYIVFTGAFDKHYTREEVIEHFIEHEAEFQDLVNYFNSKISNHKEQVWTEATRDILNEKLKKIDSDFVGRMPPQRAIQVFYKESGWGVFSYIIFDQSLTDSLISIHGKPVSKSGFGSRVVVSYVSAL